MMNREYSFDLEETIKGLDLSFERMQKQCTQTSKSSWAQKDLECSFEFDITHCADRTVKCTLDDLYELQSELTMHIRSVKKDKKSSINLKIGPEHLLIILTEDIESKLDEIIKNSASIAKHLPMIKVQDLSIATSEKQELNNDERDIQAKAQNIEKHSRKLKRLNLELVKEQERLEGLKKLVDGQLRELEEDREEFTSKIEEFKLNLNSFLDFAFMSADTPPNENDEDALKDEIDRIENSLAIANDKTREELLMKVNRLKTQLVNVRSQKTLKKSKELIRSVSPVHSRSSNVTPVRRYSPFYRAMVNKHDLHENIQENKYKLLEKQKKKQFLYESLNTKENKLRLMEIELTNKQETFQKSLFNLIRAGKSILSNI